jgi:hypothetical protein
MAELLRKAPLLFSFTVFAIGIAAVTLGQGWVINGVLPVPLVGAVFLILSSGAIALLLPGWARSSPRVRTTGQVILASTPVWRQALLLFSARASLFVDPRTAVVIYTSRTFWFRTRTELIQFKQIERIDYQRVTAAVIERYTVDLVLKDARRIRLFEFQGHEEEHAHEAAARDFLDRVRRATGLFKSSGADLDGARTCAVCGRKGPPARERCLYCGGAMEIGQ